MWWKNARAADDQDAEESDAVEEREGSGRTERVRATRRRNARVAAGRGAGSEVVEER
jgi:hypothetical protein